MFWGEIENVWRELLVVSTCRCSQICRCRMICRSGESIVARITSESISRMSVDVWGIVSSQDSLHTAYLQVRRQPTQGGVWMTLADSEINV